MLWKYNWIFAKRNDGMTLKWGIIGAGNIANSFARDLKLSKNSNIVAVTSKNIGSATQFANMFGVANVYPNIDALIADKQVDIIYIATPHNLHFEHSMKALKAGIHVLCEKPVSVGLAQLEIMQQTAKENKCFLMEAMWSRFLPAFVALEAMIKQGLIGDIKTINAQFGYNAPFDATSRIYDLNFAGGALMDIGIYPLSLAYWLLGMPDTIQSNAVIGRSGVDEVSAYQLNYKQGAIANLHSSIVANADHNAVITGTKGYVILHANWWEMQRFTFYPNEGPAQVFEFENIGIGYYHEIIAVETAVKNCQLECPLWTLGDSINICKMMDEMRNVWGLKYPL